MDKEVFYSISRYLDDHLNIENESGSFRPWVVSAESFRPGSFRPIFVVGRFGLRR